MVMLFTRIVGANELVHDPDNGHVPGAPARISPVFPPARRSGGPSLREGRARVISGREDATRQSKVERNIL